MENTFEEIRRQIHEIRNFLAPFDLKLTALDDRITQFERSVDERAGDFETRLLRTALKLGEQAVTLKDLLDRVRWIEMVQKIPPRPARGNEWPPEPPGASE